MAIPTFVIIPDERLEPDAPVRSVDALALRDNPLAIAQADDADPTPQVENAGIANGAVTAAKTSGMMLWKTVVTIRYQGSSNYHVLDNTIDWRDRFIVVLGKSYHSPGSATAEAVIPGGANDNIIGSNYGPGPATDRTDLDGWFYSRAGINSSLPMSDPHYEKAWQGRPAAITYIYVSSATGYLMAYDPDPATAEDNHTYDLMIGYSIDQGGH